MKVLYICAFYHRAMIFYDCINALNKFGYDISVFNTTWKGDHIKDKYIQIMTEKVIHKECYYKWERYFFFGKQLKMYRELLKSYNIKDYDIIHAHNLFNGGLSAYYSNKKTGVPYVVSVRASDISVFLRFGLFRRIADRIVRNAAGVQFLSEKHRDYFLNNFISNHERVSLLTKSIIAYNGLEPFWIENVHVPKKLLTDELNLLFVGKVNANKNVLTIVDSIEILIRKGFNIKLTVVGDVVDNDISVKLKEFDFVEIKGFMPKEDLISIYRSSDIYVMPSKVETFGRVYAEAMTQGLPVIYTKNQGFDGIFEDGHIGFAVPSDDPEYIAGKIIEIISNYQVISANCIKESHKFNWNDIANSLDKFYVEILKKEST